MLSKFIKDYSIDEAAVERIKHRLFVVGRFNQGNRKKPEVFLFTNRPKEELSDAYRACFNDVRSLNYERFVELLKPSLTERVEYEEGIPAEAQIPKLRQMVPRNNNSEKDREGTALVDVYHYLFLRAISSTTQTPLKSMRPNLPLGIKGVGSENAGKGIFTLIRDRLRKFATFQPRTHLIVDAISRLFDTCSRENAIPAYAHGDPLPAGFPEKLIDFVYAEDSSAPFSLEGLDLSTAPWSQLLRNKESAQMFCNVVVAFRDSLLGLHRRQFGTIWFRGRNLNEQADALFSGEGEDIEGSKERAELAAQFNIARDAFNTLRQVIKSKALISMVLDWLLDAYYELPEVPQTGVQAKKDEAVAKAILTGTANVAEPVVRPNTAERERFAESLTANFERLLTLLYEKDGDFEAKVDSVLADPELRNLARKLKKNTRLIETLGRVAAPIAGSNTRQAFIDAAKTVLLDVLCPVLFDQPILSEDDLRRFFRQETMTAYLTAIFLSKSNKDEVALIGRKNIAYFKSKIDKQSQTIRDTGELQEIFLGQFIDLLASEEIQRQMTEGLRVLREAQTILANLPVGAGAGAISAIRPDPAMQENYTLEQTPLKPKEVETSLQELVRKLVVAEPRMIAARSVNAKSSASAASSGGSASSAGGGTSSAAPAESPAAAPEDAPEPLGKGTLGDSEIAAGASAAVSSVMGAFFAGRTDSAEPVRDEDVKAITADASERLLKDDGFMGKVRKDVRAFEQVLFLIYQRYVENSGSDTSEFSNGVDRLTLINLMLLSQKELGLGTVSSNLHYMLIDMVQHLDRENPDPKRFIKKISLTRYFDNAKLGKNGSNWGFTNLRKTLKAQAHENLMETQAFVSELWGIRYLMEQIQGDERAEVVVMNATAEEFVNWVRADNLTQLGQGRFRSGKLVSGHQDESMQPGLVYLTDSAFAKDGDPKGNFLADLQANPIASRGQLRVLLPPICISTRLFKGDSWEQEGKKWATAAEDVASPVVIVGPSAFLNDPGDANKPGDYFETYLPAGYMFAAHFLRQREQEIVIRNVNKPSEGRFRVIGAGEDPMHKTLRSVIWPIGARDGYSFAADYYLYVVLTLLTAATATGQEPDAARAMQFYADFCRPKANQKEWLGTAETMTRFLVAGSGSCFTFAAPITGSKSEPVISADGTIDPDLKAILLDEAGISDTRDKRQVTDVKWFNLARKSANLH